MRILMTLCLILGTPFLAAAETNMTTDPATGDQTTSVHNGPNAADITQGGGTGNSADVTQSGGATATVVQRGNGNVAVIRQSGRSTVTSRQGDGPPIASVTQDGSAGHASVTQFTR